MTQKDLFQTVTSSQRDIRANHSPSRESKKAQKMTATSGRLSLELLHKKDRLGAFSKTFMVTSQWVSTKCSLTWKAKATPQGRLLFQLAVSTLPIKETDFGSSPTVNWPTPSASDVEGGVAQDVELENGTFSRKNKDGVRWGMKLRDAVNHAEKMWPTPVARDHKGGYQGGRIRNGKVSWDSLDVAVQHTDNQEKTGGQLNPMFVEWLMGYPKGWTELKD